ncbi:alpha/beta fold hydrolase [Alteribacillus sp. YIM 98480]|uniref:alpha/beta fold hydrolase n=1 Tax=Alteribacillus sp. YIM 98480 TaxID=2606599 RepID=UPI00131BE31F|nr:alpha/beta hydrolase [Alteribacillus sp. YIM 98480]
MSKPIEKELSIPGRPNVTGKVLIAGEGEPLVFLHGAGGLVWDPYLEKLSEHYKVYAPYHPGTGGTIGSEEIRDWWDLVLYYYDLFDELKLDTVNVIGHSFGGMVAAELAATDPKRVNQLVLLSATGLWMEDVPSTDVFTLTNTPDALFAAMFVDPESSAAQVMKELPEDPDEQLKALVENRMSLAETSKYMWPIPDKGLSRRIHRIQAETCIIWGEKDGLIPVDYAYEFKRLIKNAKQVNVFENASHFPQLEELDKTVKTTRDFLASKSAVK